MEEIFKGERHFSIFSEPGINMVHWENYGIYFRYFIFKLKIKQLVWRPTNILSSETDVMIHSMDSNLCQVNGAQIIELNGHYMRRNGEKLKINFQLEDQCSEALLNNLGITVNNTALYTYKLLKGRFSMSSGQKRNAIMWYDGCIS